MATFYYLNPSQDEGLAVERQTKYGEKYHETRWNLNHSSTPYSCESKETDIFSVGMNFMVLYLRMINTSFTYMLDVQHI